MNNKLVTEKFIFKIKISPRRQYELAQEAGFSSGMLSHFLNGISQPSVTDKRFIKLGKLIGVGANEIFKQNKE
ncbi:hypothetical protein BVY03_05850 [bacterium K02(2017)]|nr:hypothetical protein BVY03_05850 [bacterium K02(2017)]